MAGGPAAGLRPIWGQGPFDAADPIVLAKLCSEAETSQAISEMQEETAAWEAAQREAARVAHERSWQAVLASPFLHPGR